MWLAQARSGSNTLSSITPIHASSPILSLVLQVTRAVFEASQGRLKVVGRAGVGIDNVDLQAATEVSARPACNTINKLYLINIMLQQLQS